jgi:hypothetical protein
MERIRTLCGGKDVRPALRWGHSQGWNEVGLAVGLEEGEGEGREGEGCPGGVVHGWGVLKGV